MLLPWMPGAVAPFALPSAHHCDLMFSEKFMSNVLAANLMLAGLLFLFPTIPILLGWK